MKPSGGGGRGGGGMADGDVEGIVKRRLAQICHKCFCQFLQKLESRTLKCFLITYESPQNA